MFTLQSSLDTLVPTIAFASQGLGKRQHWVQPQLHFAYPLSPTVANAQGRARQVCTRNTLIAQQFVAQITLNS